MVVCTVRSQPVNMSVTYLQSIRMIHLKLLEELISQSMHYQYYGKQLTVKKIDQVQNAVNLSKKNVFGIKILHAHLQYVCNIPAKY